MAYGTLRAVKILGNYYCVRCACDRVERREIATKNTHMTLAAMCESVALVDPNNLYTLENDGIDAYILNRLIAHNWLEIEGILREGQSPDQRILEEHECYGCHKFLRDDCTDY